MENKEKHIGLLQKLFDQKDLSSEELKMLFRIFNSEKGNIEIRDLLDKFRTKPSETNFEDIDSKKIFLEIKSAIRYKQFQSNHKLKVFYQWTSAIAAVLLLALLISGILFLDVQIKGNKIINLTEISAPEGKIRHIRLADGTSVWMNPGSSLVYSSELGSKKIRDVRLWGQAFFEVAKDEKHPFILQLGDIGVKVTGTSFNASNYKDDSQVEVVLKTGHVKLFRGYYKDAEEFVKLEPGEIAEYDKGKAEFTVHRVDVGKYTAWMNGMLIFRDDLMSEVFRQLERWYNIKIVVTDPKINNYLYTATIKNESLDQILKLLEYTSQLKYEVIKNNPAEKRKQTILISAKN